MSINEVGCCGAYCGTCPALSGGTCRGCKLGYANGGRDIDKARCQMKVCCIKRTLMSCADCADYQTCSVIGEFHSKNGHKYKKYKQALDYIRDNGYVAFLLIAETWTKAYGKYK
ncbi:MAG: DUF3795 domain-containing protein [Candidatus Saccharibacteria bacterium]